MNVGIQNRDWADYRVEQPDGVYQVWRASWCADYPDAYNFLHLVIGYNVGGLGNWSNSAYDDLLSEAVQEPDSQARQELYRQAEEILVETDAVLVPLYYPTSLVACKPYLERSFGTVAPDFANWHFTTVQESIGTAGGTVSSHDGSTRVRIPAGAYSETVTFTYRPATGADPGAKKTATRHVFELNAVESDSGHPAQLAPGSTYTIAVEYLLAEVKSVFEDTLALYHWSNHSWVKEPSSTLDTGARTITANPDHLSVWAVIGTTKKELFLPVVLTGR